MHLVFCVNIEFLFHFLFVPRIRQIYVDTRLNLVRLLNNLDPILTNGATDILPDLDNIQKHFSDSPIVSMQQQHSNYC
jgi:hypothetical protein